MNPIPNISILFLGLALPALAQAPPTAKLAAAAPVADGVYVGLEPMQSENPHEPDALWYHENTVVARGGELILDENPVSIREGRKTYSASDGGFITYRGRFLTKTGRVYVSLRPFASDYVFFPIGPKSCEAYSRVDIYPVKVTDKGFWINGVLYTANTVEAKHLKYLEDELKSEPFEYDGKHPYNRKWRLPACKPNDLSVLDD
jgi:hypothetical protein